MADNAIIKEGSSLCANAEADAGATITPGMLLELAADGDYEPHGTADGVNTYLYADLNHDPADDKDDDYAAGERVRAQHVRPGVKVEVIVGESQDLGPGDLLVSDGDGTLVERAAEAYGVVVGYVAEGESVTTGSAETGRVDMWVV